MNLIKTLKDSHNHTIGYIYDNGDKLVIEDENHRRKGFYEKNKDQTRDDSNRLIGQGNLLVTLL